MQISDPVRQPRIVVFNNETRFRAYSARETSVAEELGPPEEMRLLGPRAVGRFAEFQCKEGELKVVLDVGERGRST